MSHGVIISLSELNVKIYHVFMINCYNSLNSLTNKFSYDVVAKIQRDIYIFTCIFVLFRLSKTGREHIAAVSEEAVICTSLVM